MYRFNTYSMLLEGSTSNIIPTPNKIRIDLLFYFINSVVKSTKPVIDSYFQTATEFQALRLTLKIQLIQFRKKLLFIFCLVLLFLFSFGYICLKHPLVP